MADDDNNTPPGDGSGSGGTPPPKPITQDDVSRVAAAEAAKGKRQGQKETLEALGFSSADEAKQFIESIRNREDDELSEAQKVLKKAEEKERKAEEATRAANEKLLDARVERALEAQGVPVTASPKVRRLVEGLDHESSDEEISAAVTVLKGEMPQMFGEVEPPTPPPPGTPPPPAPGDPGKPPATPGIPPDSQQQAKDLLARRHPQTVKQ